MIITTLIRLVFSYIEKVNLSFDGLKFKPVKNVCSADMVAWEWGGAGLRERRIYICLEPAAK